MKIKKIISLVVALQMVFALLVPGTAVMGEEAIPERYADIFKVSEENAYILLGEEVIENGIDFLDGLEMGIEDTNHVLWNEVSSEQGIDGRKFYVPNYLALNVEPNKFTKEDTEFLIYVTYFDFGPSRGSFLFEYFNGDGQSKSVTIIKPGTVQQFNTECFYVDGMDFTKTFSNTGSNIRLKTNGWNLFKKIEIVSLSKLKREGKSLKELAYMAPSSKRDELIGFGLLDADNSDFSNSNLQNDCTYGDAADLLERINDGNPVLNPSGYKSEDAITQKDLVIMALDMLGLSSGDTAPVEYASQIGLIKSVDFIYSPDIAASYYSVAAVANNILFFQDAQKVTPIEKLMKKGFWGDQTVNSNRTLIAFNHRYPKSLPSKTITENATGQTYHYMNIKGIKTLRTYVTEQSWNSDGTGFVCGFDTGELFYYDIEKETLQYIDKILTLTDRLCAVMGTDDYVYYPKLDDEGYCGIYKANIKDIPSNPQLVGRRKDKYQFYTPHISNDCKYMGVDLSIPGLGTCVSRYDIEKDEWLDYHMEFDYADNLQHPLINPGYPDIISYCHDLGDGMANGENWFRIWQINIVTDTEGVNIYKQGIRDTTNLDVRWPLAIEGATHEVWSNTGDYMYYISPDLETGNIGHSPSTVRFDKDGSHRQYFDHPTADTNEDKHCYPSGDDKFVVTDGNSVVLISTETHERFEISQFQWMSNFEHPNHAHPVVARNRYIVNWGAFDENRVTGIKWFDFTELAKQQAKGGRYEAGEHLERISYEALDSESSEVTYKGRKAFLAKNDKYIYFDISPELIDTVNGKIKLSFDYYDNGFMPIKVCYTSGVETDNDHWRVYDNSKIIKRTNTKQWKHYEVVIDSGNFESIGKHFSDIKITGTPANLYISDVKVSIPE